MESLIAKDISWRRRLITTTIWFTLATVMPIVTIVLLPVLLVTDLVKRNQFASTRVFMFVSYFFVLDSACLTWAFGLWLRQLVFAQDQQTYEHKNRILQLWWAGHLFWTPLSLFNTAVEIDGLEHLENARPTLVFSRHASVVDTMIPMAIAQEMKYFRYVIKAELLLDPCLDFVAQRFPNAFVRRDAGVTESQIERINEMGQNLELTGAVVVFPEGTRFTNAKRTRLIERFAEKNDALLDVATELKFTLPPLREGAVRLIESASEADVVFIAHRGIDDVSTLKSVSNLIDRTLEIKLWRVNARDVPRDPEAIKAFMIENWKIVDAFAGGETVETTPVRHDRAS